MPRHTQPVEIARIKGADKKNPQRYRNEVPKSSLPLGEAPDHMEDPAIACWFEISAYSLPGVVTGADRIALEVLSNLLAEYREDPTKFPVSKLRQLIGSLGRFGMTPSDRTKLGIEKNKQDNPFASLDD